MWMTAKQHLGSNSVSNALTWPFEAAHEAISRADPAVWVCCSLTVLVSKCITGCL